MYNQLSNDTTNGETSPEEPETEKTNIVSSPTTPDSYGSTPVEDRSTDGCYVPVCGLIFYIMSFFGFFCSMTLREALSVAIVDMVNQTTVTEADVVRPIGSDIDECPRDPELEYEEGEFNWNRIQQAIILSAFYYGYGITQVHCIKS